MQSYQKLSEPKYSPAQDQTNQSWIKPVPGGQIDNMQGSLNLLQPEPCPAKQAGSPQHSLYVCDGFKACFDIKKHN